MSILLFQDDACTIPVSTPQKFTVASTVSPFQTFTLTNMSGSDMYALYMFNGTNHIKLLSGVDYNLSGNTITLTSALPSANVLIAVPNERLNLNFGGVFGASKTSTTFVIFKRQPAYTYDTLLLASENLDNTPFAQTFVDQAVSFQANQSMANNASVPVTGSKATGVGFNNLTPNALQGYAFVLNNQYIGIVIANDANAVLIDNVGFTYTGTPTDTCSIFSIGSLTYALDVSNSIPTDGSFVPVLSLPPLNSNQESVKVWLRDTLIIPETATNFPNQAFKLTGIEYLA